jgi:hypothetical protein
MVSIAGGCMTSITVIIKALDFAGVLEVDQIGFCQTLVGRTTPVSRLEGFSFRELEILESFFKRSPVEAVRTCAASWKARAVSLEEMISSTVSSDPARYSRAELKDRAKQFLLETHADPREAKLSQFLIWLEEDEELLKPVVPVARANRLETQEVML